MTTQEIVIYHSAKSHYIVLIYLSALYTVSNVYLCVLLKEMFNVKNPNNLKNFKKTKKSKYNTGDKVLIRNRYHGFIKNTIATVVNPYKNGEYCIIIEDFRGITGPIPTDYIKPVKKKRKHSK